jgi:hypothetical protein
MKLKGEKYASSSERHFDGFHVVEPDVRRLIRQRRAGEC